MVSACFKDLLVNGLTPVPMPFVKQPLKKSACHSSGVHDLLLLCHRGLLRIIFTIVIYYLNDTVMHRLAIGGE